MGGWIDFHAHVLPCDHGSDSAATSLRQLARARAAGVAEIVATPHFYANRQSLQGFLKARKRALDKVYAANDSAIFPRLRLGAEVLLCEGLENLAGIESLCVEGTNVLLLEMPFSGMNERLLNSLYHLQSRHCLRVVLAHIDRYDEKTVREALAAGARAQLNVESICAFFKRRQCRKWIAQGVVEAIGSDVHMDGEQYKKFKKAVDILGKDADVLLSRTQNLLQDRKIHTIA